MLDKVHRRFTYANTMSTLAVFFAISGSSYADLAINGANIKMRSVAGTKLRVNTISGVEVNESTLRQVPRARTVGGFTAERLRITCPSDTFAIAGICVERTVRRAATYGSAVLECAQAGTGRRLPTLDELRAALTEVQLARGGELTANVYPSASDPAKLDTLYVTGQAGSVALAADTASGTRPYRCITNRSN
jgi:hypothetical protein